MRLLTHLNLRLCFEFEILKFDFIFYDLVHYK